MKTLLVYESMWGNTKTVAETIAGALGDDATLVEVRGAPTTLPPDIDLLVVGGPTHAFSMSRPSTRHDAETKGADASHTDTGIREWLEALPASDIRVATFDTRVGSVRHLPGSAARAAAKEVRRHHLGHLVDTQSFYVADTDGPLLDGELDRAHRWAQKLISERKEPHRRIT